MNIYIYWIGDEKVKEKIRNNFSLLSKTNKTIKINIGPTSDEHEFLIKNYKFYSVMYENKKYSFCSDLYRVWKLSENSGLYIDANTLIDYKRFHEILELVKNARRKQDKASIFIKENGHIIWNGFIYSNNQDFFKKILNFYKTFPSVSSKLTGPLILSMIVYREFGSKLNVDENNFYLDARNIDPFSDKSIIKYNGFGSWGKNKEIEWDKPEKSGAHTYFHKNANNFRKGKYNSWFWVLIRWCIKHYFIYLLPYIKIKELITK